MAEPHSIRKPSTFVPSAPTVSRNLEPSGMTPAGSSFAVRLRALGDQSIRAMARDVDRGERLIRRALRPGRAPLNNGELLALQAGVYRYTQALELAGKIVDKTTSAVRQTLQSQQ